MYTGIIHHQVTIQAIEPQSNNNILFTFRISPQIKKHLHVDDSVSIEGVCLTVIKLKKDSFSTEAMPETIRLTTLGGLEQNQRVNFELSLLAADRLGGHFVMGHVDGVGIVTKLKKDGGSLRVTIKAARKFMPFIAPKGTIAVNGVSLTITEVTGTSFGVALIPHTLKKTTLGVIQEGSRVNLEIDMIARTVVRFLATQRKKSL